MIKHKGVFEINQEKITVIATSPVPGGRFRVPGHQSDYITYSAGYSVLPSIQGTSRSLRRGNLDNRRHLNKHGQLEEKSRLRNLA